MSGTTNGGTPGEIPAGWEWKKLGDIADCRLGKMLDKQKNVGELRPYLRNINVQWGRVDLSDIKQMRIKDEEVERYEVRGGDLLVCEGGEPGRCAVWRNDRPMFLQKALHRVRPYEGILPAFLQSYLHFAAYTGQLDALLTGTTIKHLPRQRLIQIPVAVPSVTEQQSIVKTLDAFWLRLDNAEVELNRAAMRVIQLRQSALRQAFSGGLSTRDSKISE